MEAEEHDNTVSDSVQGRFHEFNGWMNLPLGIGRGRRGGCRGRRTRRGSGGGAARPPPCSPAFLHGIVLNGEFKGLDERLMEDLSLGRRKGIDDFEAISARHCLWILGNAMTPRGSGLIWGELVQDAMERRCLFDYVWHECFSF
ncbi:uncharacterized protein LOC123447745 [Hordeum vulgare subsp. vulgare]|uniref:uncharacterized protein LOC123447745 n=1 Tax=Hordeum vulgare subsp. vulgare TaxID=112509 RepID=UPI001D1A52FC|nr:uncharacterized protein LOC123447745 [Hordeum vulgare subsp. vulgare]